MTDTSNSGANALRKNSLGLIAVTFMVISAAAPLTGVAGAMPFAFLMGNAGGVPLTFAILTLVMLAFAVGYVAMSRHVTNAGAFYAYAARGLGGQAGGAISIVAVVAYNAMQFGLIGLFGGIAASVLGAEGIVLPWYAWSLIAVLLVGFLGYRQVELSAKILVVLVALEYLIVLIVDIAILMHGGPEGTTAPLFDVTALTTGSLTAATLFCLGSFIGIEATTIYGEEARDPENTIPKATYLSVAMIGIFFIFTTWLMIKGVGTENLVPTIGALPDPTSFFFDLTGQYVGGGAARIAGFLMVSSLFAALSAFHNYVARYTYVAGREGLLPAALGQTHALHQSPHVGSIAQTVCSLVVLAIFAGLGLDPIGQMFTWIAQIGTLGVLLMMGVTSLAVFAFFRKQGGGSAMATTVLPIMSAVILLGLFVYIFLNFGDLTGTAGGALGWVLPALIPAGAVIGWLLAARLKSTDPRAFANLGQNRL